MERGGSTKGRGQRKVGRGREHLGRGGGGGAGHAEGRGVGGGVSLPSEERLGSVNAMGGTTGRLEVLAKRIFNPHITMHKRMQSRTQHVTRNTQHSHR